jgi:hypothetical protein
MNFPSKPHHQLHVEPMYVDEPQRMAPLLIRDAASAPTQGGDDTSKKSSGNEMWKKVSKEDSSPLVSYQVSTHKATTTDESGKKRKAWKKPEVKYGSSHCLDTLSSGLIQDDSHNESVVVSPLSSLFWI